VGEGPDLPVVAVVELPVAPLLLLCGDEEQALVEIATIDASARIPTDRRVLLFTCYV
jgi:hypothetical protein